MLEEFTRHYIACLRWADMPEDRPAEWVYNSPNLVKRAQSDCESFMNQTVGLYSVDDIPQAAHDFWLTRQHHGAGFWDGDWPDVGDELTKISQSFPELSVYIGDDGLLYAD